MIKRIVFKDIQANLEKKEMSILIGPRQAGKTTLMLQLQQELVKKGQRTVFLNLDIERHKQFFISQEALLQKIHLEIGHEKGYVFIDEIQRKTDAGVFLKGLFDMNLPYKFIVSGSGSLELKEKIHESLVGRKRLFFVSTVTFSEFFHFKTNYRYEDRLAEFLKVEPATGLTLLQEYLQFGGYPRVVIEPTAAEKKTIIDDIYQSYLDKDIVGFLGVHKSGQFSDLVRLLASQIGQLINISELSQTLGLAAATIKQYLWYLEKTFILNKVTPFFRNHRKEITKAPIFYFHDIGLRNYALNLFGQPLPPQDSGWLFQNFIYNLLRLATIDQPITIHFWRSKEAAEVDFVLKQGTTILPLEVKYSNLKKPDRSRSLTSFIKKYTPANCLLINLSLESQRKFQKTSFDIVPYHSLMLPNFITDHLNIRQTPTINP